MSKKSINPTMFVNTGIIKIDATLNKFVLSNGESLLMLSPEVLPNAENIFKLKKTIYLSDKFILNLKSSTQAFTLDNNTIASKSKTDNGNIAISSETFPANSFISPIIKEDKMSVFKKNCDVECKFRLNDLSYAKVYEMLKPVDVAKASIPCIVFDEGSSLFFDAGRAMKISNVEKVFSNFDGVKMGYSEFIKIIDFAKYFAATGIMANIYYTSDTILMSISKSDGNIIADFAFKRSLPNNVNIFYEIAKNKIKGIKESKIAEFTIPESFYKLPLIGSNIFDLSIKKDEVQIMVSNDIKVVETYKNIKITGDVPVSAKMNISLCSDVLGIISKLNSPSKCTICKDMLVISNKEAGISVYISTLRVLRDV